MQEGLATNAPDLKPLPARQGIHHVCCTVDVSRLDGRARLMTYHTTKTPVNIKFP